MFHRDKFPSLCDNDVNFYFDAFEFYPQFVVILFQKVLSFMFDRFCVL